MRSQASGAKVVLVITGKGVRGDGERGVLKRQVPMWLRLPEFRDMVVGFETAGIGHGGEGAMYVRLRRFDASTGHPPAFVTTLLIQNSPRANIVATNRGAALP